MKNSLPDKVLRITRKMDYVLSVVFLGVALYMATQGAWGMAAIIGASAAISFAVARLDLSRRLVMHLFFARAARQASRASH